MFGQLAPSVLPLPLPAVALGSGPTGPFVFRVKSWCHGGSPAELLWPQYATPGCVVSECLPNGLCQCASRGAVQL